jgi:hypothetical protein
LFTTSANGLVPILLILQRVVTNLLNGRHDGHHRQGGEEQRVAVRLRLGDKIGGDSAARAWLVLNDEGLAEGFAEMLRGHACKAVGIAARGKGHDDGHRPLRPVSLRRHRR